ncbi:hypothetical protein WJX81_006711 [Elliptochloris bilobata]|uniref:PKD domain-containing protein n=1 Tax=Elliptochloris bilobata TaxID=381761 RepID=A0AAW1S129_9CHLO
MPRSWLPAQLAEPAGENTPALNLTVAQPNGIANVSLVAATALLTVNNVGVPNQNITFSTVGNTGGAVVQTNATGYAVANANFTLPGFYNVSATFPGNTTTTPTLNGAVAFAGLTVAQASITFTNNTPIAANTQHTFTFNALLELDSLQTILGATLVFNFGDGTSATATTGTNGIATVTHKYATAGTYNSNVTYAGTLSFNNSGSVYPVLPSAGNFAATTVSTTVPTIFSPNSVTLVPSPRASPTIVPPYYLVGDALNAYATLTVAATGAAAPGVTVLFTDISGALIGTKVTNASGTATQPFTFTLPGNYTIVANVSQADTTQYGLATTNTQTYVLDQTQITLTATQATTGASTVSVTGTLSAALTTVGAGGTILVNWGDGTIDAATTSASGSFSDSYTYPATGTYTVNVTFQGSPTTLPSTSPGAAGIFGDYLLPTSTTAQVTVTGGTPTPSPTPSPTGTGTPTPTPSPSPTGSFTPTPTPTVSPGQAVNVAVYADPASQSPPQCGSNQHAQTFRGQLMPQFGVQNNASFPLGTCTFQLYNPKTSVGYNLGTVTVWPPTHPNQYLQMYSLCQVQVNLAIPAGEYNVQVIYHSTNGYADSWGKLYPFYVNELCQLQDKIEKHLATDPHLAG